jgi:hypothetical protein
MSLAPPWVGKLPDRDQNRAARYRGMTADERLALFVEACRLAAAVLRHRPDREAVLSRRDEPSDEAMERWRRLVEEAARARAAG